MLDAAAAAERELAALRLDLGASARDALARLEGGRARAADAEAAAGRGE